MSEKQQDTSRLSEKRKPYHKPRLRKHGLIARITTGGSGAMQEMGMMNMATLRFP